MARKTGAQVLEGFPVLLDGVALGEQDGVVAPADALGSDLLLEGEQRINGGVDVGHAGLDVGSVGCDRVLEMRVEAVRDLVQARQDGGVVLGAELHAVDDRGVELVARDLVREEGVAHEDEPLLEPPEQPGRVVLHDVGALARADDHAITRSLPG